MNIICCLCYKSANDGHDHKVRNENFTLTIKRICQDCFYTIRMYETPVMYEGPLP